MNMERICRVCLSPFTATKANAVYCSVDCRDNPQHKWAREKARRRRKTERPCELCGKDRGPNYSICQVCVRATRGCYDESVGYSAW